MGKRKGSNKFPINGNKGNYEEQLRDIFDNLPCAFAVFDAIKTSDVITDFVCKYINKIGLDDLEITEEEILNKKFHEIFPENFKELLNECADVIKEGSSRQIEFPFFKQTNKRKTKITLNVTISQLKSSLTLSWKVISNTKKESINIESEVRTLPNAEELFLKTFYASPDAIIISRKNDGKILEVNRSAEVLFGYTKEEITGKTTVELGLFIDVKDRENKLNNLLENKYLRDFSIDIIRKTGEIRQASLSIEYLNVEGEKCILKCVRDITERKQTEAMLKIREAQLDAFFANSPAILNLVDENFCYINTDKLTPTYYGLDRETIKGKCVQELSPDFIEQTGKVMQHVIETGEPILNAQFQSPVPGRQGEMAYWTTSFFRVPLGTKKWGVGVISVEVTDIKRSEQKLIESEERFRTLADNISQLTWMANPNGSIFWYNKRWYDYTGTTLDEMKGWGWQKVHHPDYIEHVVENWRKALKEGNSWEDVFPLKSKDGEYRWFLSRALPIRDNDEKILRWFGTNTDITERINTEEAVNTKIAELNAILDSIADGVVIYDISGKILRSNVAADEILKYTQSDREATMLDRLKERYGVWSEDGYKLKAEEMPAMRAINYGEIVKNILVKVQGAGEPHWVNVSASPLFVSGKQIGAVVSLSDITERKKAEEALQDSELRFRTLVTASSEVLYRMSPDWSKMLQLDGRGFLIDTESENPNWLQEYIHPDDQSHVMAVIDESIQKKRVFELEHRVRQADESWGWTYSRAVPLMDTDGNIIEWFGAANDFTKRKIAEEAVKKAKEQYDLLFNSINEGFAHYKAVYDGNGRLYDLLVLEINPAGAALSGVKREDQIGKTWNQVWTGIEDSLFDIYREVDLSGEQVIFEHFSGITKKWYTNRIYKITKDQFAVTFFDITARKEAMLKLEKALQELQLSNRDIEQYAYITSHDLKEPIRMVYSYTQLLQKKFNNKLDESANKYLNFIQEGASRLHMLINDLVNYTQLGIKERNFRYVDMNDIMASVLNNLKDKIENNKADIKFSKLPQITADPSQIKQLLINLLDNAIKFRKERKPIIEINSHENENEWFFTIKDNGIGFKQEHSERIFSVFQRLNNREDYIGNGVGLALCKRIIGHHNGRIWAESEPGKGTIFYFTIPKR